jgi:hypothetical protein
MLTPVRSLLAASVVAVFAVLLVSRPSSEEAAPTVGWKTVCSGRVWLQPIDPKQPVGRRELNPGEPFLVTAVLADAPVALAIGHDMAGTSGYVSLQGLCD